MARALVIGARAPQTLRGSWELARVEHDPASGPEMLGTPAWSGSHATRLCLWPRRCVRLDGGMTASRSISTPMTGGIGAGSTHRPHRDL